MTEAIVNTGTLAFRMKVRWFEDILAHPPARRHLWNLYYAGEAYEELHPDGIFIGMLPEGSVLQKQLTKHLADETRHATIFRAFLAQDGWIPAPLDPREDVGWHLLTHVVPDVVAWSKTCKRFDRPITIRYMAFLHALELRSISDLCALIQAARNRGETDLVEKLETILPDERFHATYTHRAVIEGAETPEEARRVLKEILTAERKFMSSTTLRCLNHFLELGAAPREFSGRFRWGVMKAFAWMGLAVPLLPRYDRVPAHLLPEAL